MRRLIAWFIQTRRPGLVGEKGVRRIGGGCLGLVGSGFVLVRVWRANGEKDAGGWGGGIKASAFGLRVVFDFLRSCVYKIIQFLFNITRNIWGIVQIQLFYNHTATPTATIHVSPTTLHPHFRAHLASALPAKICAPVPFTPLPNPAVMYGAKASVLDPTTTSLSPGARLTSVPLTVTAPPAVSICDPIIYCVSLLAVMVSEPIVIAGGVVATGVGVKTDVLGA